MENGDDEVDDDHDHNDDDDRDDVDDDDDDDDDGGDDGEGDDGEDDDGKDDDGKEDDDDADDDDDDDGDGDDDDDDGDGDGDCDDGDDGEDGEDEDDYDDDGGDGNSDGDDDCDDGDDGELSIPNYRREGDSGLYFARHEEFEREENRSWPALQRRANPCPQCANGIRRTGGQPLRSRPSAQGVPSGTSARMPSLGHPWIPSAGRQISVCRCREGQTEAQGCHGRLGLPGQSLWLQRHLQVVKQVTTPHWATLPKKFQLFGCTPAQIFSEVVSCCNWGNTMAENDPFSLRSSSPQKPWGM